MNHVFYLKVSESGDLEQNLASLGSPEQIREWIRFGAVYVDGRRQRENLALNKDQTIRAHTLPKRYEWTPRDLKDRIVWDEDDLLVLDKPGGLPTHPTLDNYWENAKQQLEIQLGHSVYTTHRLDIPTEGLLIFAKNAGAQKEINRLFQKGRVQKIYRAITDAKVSVGLHVHHMDPDSRPPKILSSTARDNWWSCQMEVLNCEPRADGGFNLEIRLLTGKTHQIRSQCRFLNSPIRGDKIYGSVKNYVRERIALECYSLSFTFRSRTITLFRKNSLATPR